MSDRTFGVEIEHGNDDLDEDDVRRLLRENELADWAHNVHEDGSGIEVVSPILHVEDGFDKLKKVMALLKANGGWCSEDDGFHVHYGGAEFLDDDEGEKRVINLISSWASNQQIINHMLPKCRRNAHTVQGIDCCMQLDRKKAEELFAYMRNECEPPDRTRYDDTARNNRQGMKHYKIGPKCQDMSRFYALNVQALHRHGTIEIRQHQGTLDFARSASWIRFGHALIECVLEHGELKGFTTARKLCKAIGLKESDITRLETVTE